jgi:hypothetical protein
MLDKQGLHTLLGLDISSNAPGIIIYTSEKSERLDYACEFIFSHVLKLKYAITSQPGEFENSAYFKINYSSTVMNEIFQVIPGGLLMEKKITELKPEAVFINDTIYFYVNEEIKKDDKTFAFDIFSAVFYFISRLEEWQYFEPDRHQRFEAEESILYKHKFHLKPVADQWILELRSSLEKFYPSLKFPVKHFKTISTIDVDNLYAYKAKGFLRTLGACAKDILKFDLKNLGERIQVLRKKKDDPFDIYNAVSEFCFEERILLIWFFLFKTGTKYDRTVDPRSPSYTNVFAILKNNHALFGLHPSYNSSVQKALLQQEIKDLSLKSKEKIDLSRQHYLRFNIRSTPGLLLENDIIADFSMGFASLAGFRAGTSHPFYYYDFNTEKKTELLFVPFCVMDGVYTVYSGTDPNSAYQSMLDLAKEVKKVNGLFISVFHERTFSDHLYKGFGTLYKNLHLKIKEL